MTGETSGLTLVGCVDTRAHRSTTANVRGGPGTRATTIIGSGTANFPQGIAGDAGWRRRDLTLVHGGAATIGDMTVRGRLLLGTFPAPAAITDGSVVLDRERYLYGMRPSGGAARLIGMDSNNVVQLGGNESYVALPRVPAASLPEWSPSLRGFVCWDVTNDRLIVYGSRMRHYFAPTGSF